MKRISMNSMKIKSNACYSPYRFKLADEAFNFMNEYFFGLKWKTWGDEDKFKIFFDEFEVDDDYLKAQQFMGNGWFWYIWVYFDKNNKIDPDKSYFATTEWPDERDKIYFPTMYKLLKSYDYDEVEEINLNRFTR